MKTKRSSLGAYGQEQQTLCDVDVESIHSTSIILEMRISHMGQYCTSILTITD